ncbi:MAG TPA: TraR/DksA C4-type zinc finger protein [Candidatus Paceibacterota bacterium]|nr:TraR/DksA C4-type zinc finger protein [Candidatus Paceibacterota bacterium]
MNNVTVEVAVASSRTRFSDEELNEFRLNILRKMEIAQFTLNDLMGSLSNSAGNGTEDTSPTFKVLEEGNNTMSKEENSKLALSQSNLIQNLKAALVRIENKTYGICSVTGKLMPKERLMATPHATKCVEVKSSPNHQQQRLQRN